MKLMVILGSVREGRNGKKVSRWINHAVSEDSRFELDFVDLAELDLPFYNESFSPKYREIMGMEYKNPKGKTWSERVGKADGYLLITPEYNHGYPAVLKNALDWVGNEWANKPVTFVSYSVGGMGGVRAVEQLRQVVPELGLHQTGAAVYLGDIANSIDDSGKAASEASDKALAGILDALLKI